MNDLAKCSRPNGVGHFGLSFGVAFPRGFGADKTRLTLFLRRDLSYLTNGSKLKSTTP